MPRNPTHSPTSSTTAPIIAAVLVLGALQGCDSPKGDALPADSLVDVDYASVPSESLPGRQVFQDSTLDGAWQLWRVGNSLLVGPGSGDSVVAVVSLADFRRQGFLGRFGVGPGEFRAVNEVYPLPSGDRVAILDPTQHRLTFRPTGQLSALRRPKDEVVTTAVSVFRFVPLTDTTFATQAFTEEARIAVRNDSGRVLSRFGELAAADRGLPLHVRQHAYQSTPLASPGRDRLALLLRHSGSIELYNVDGTRLPDASTPFRFDPRITVAGAKGRVGFDGGEGLRFGYVGGVAAREGFLALFSGHTRGGGAEIPTSGEHIHAFDWDGRLVRVLRLERPTAAIALSEDGRTLYGGVELPEPGVIAYSLPADLFSTPPIPSQPQ